MLCAEDKLQCHNTWHFFFTNFLILSYFIEFQPGIAMHIPDRVNAALILAINESKLPVFQADFTERDTIKQTKGLIKHLF